MGIGVFMLLISPIIKHWMKQDDLSKPGMVDELQVADH
jgi:hypothetical protein